MKYEKTRAEFYEQEIHGMARQLSEILDRGCSVELAKSRSGIKIFSVLKQHQIIRRNNPGMRGNEDE
jgi:hypothetical protein